MKNIDEIMKQYAKDIGMTEDQLASYILQEYGEPQKGIVTPDDNGWTDLKKLGLAIGDSWNKHRENTDPMWRVGLVNAIFGDTSMLGNYYQMMNSNEQNRLNREAQNEYNKSINDIDAVVKAKERQRQLAAVELGDELRDKVDSGELSRFDAMSEAHKAFREGSLTYEELKDLRNRLNEQTTAEKADEEARKEAKETSDKYKDNATSRNIEKLNKEREEKAEKKALADAGRNAIANNRKPTRKQQKAIDEGY